jgi:ATP-dependent DNA helicase RecQ
VIQLQKGLAVFRQAMTIHLDPAKRSSRYTEEDYKPLRAHYRERTFQIHVVMVQTYHGLALRLTGTSLAAAAQAGAAEPDFARLIDDANEMLRQPAAGTDPAPGLGAPMRERLLAGFSHVLVDEYQDINAAQYELVGHLAGRREDEPERRLPILAVGDDDQTIYGWNGADVEFLRRFQADYPGTEVRYLVENFRSSGHIIACSNRLIQHNRDRMKQGHPARVDGARAAQPPGGRWAVRDPSGGGRVRLLRVAGAGEEAMAVVGHLLALRRLDPTLAWRECAVLARTHRELEPIRALCESRELPLIWAADRDKLPPLHRVREIAALLAVLAARRGGTLRASELLSLAERGTLPEPGAPAASAASAPGERGEPMAPPASPWTELLREILVEWQEETGDAEVAAGEASEFLHDALAERRREPVRGEGIYVGTVHGAKGLEFSHVVIADGGWAPRAGGEDEEAERRLYYVGMTRARDTLALVARRDERNPQVRLLEEGAAAGDLEVLEPALGTPPNEVLARRFVLFGLGDLFLDFAGRRPAGDPIHARLARLRPGDLLTARQHPEGWIELLDASAAPVAALSQSGREAWAAALGASGQPDQIRVVALVERRAADSKLDFQPSLRCTCWQVPVVELRYRAS